MVRPSIMQPQAAFVLAVLGGATGTILMTAFFYVAPAFGLPLIDLPRLIGGVFSTASSAVLVIGYILFFLVGVFVMPLVLAYFWPSLPGEGIGFLGAAIKGLILGVFALVLSGVALWLLGAVNGSAAQGSPGLFALNQGLAGLLTLAAAHVAYGLTVALIAAMPQGISPVDTLGWTGHGVATTDPVALEAKKALSGNGQRPGYRAG